MPRPASFPTGYLRDDEKTEYPSHYQLLSAGPPTLQKADHLFARKGLIWQADVGMCVGAWLKRAVQLWLELNGHAAPAMISGKFAYDIGRSMAYAGMEPENVPPLRDAGSQVRLVLVGAQRLGLADEAHYPDPTSPDWNPANVNRRPSPDDIINAYDMRDLEFYEVSRGAWGIRESIRACMVRRHPVGIALFVDSGVFANEGEIVTDINESDPSGGGHMVGVLDASHDEYAVLDNWWDNPGLGIEWGMPLPNALDLPRGVWRVAWPLLESRIKACFAVEAVPLQRAADAIA